jgi:hypothetical protein
MYKICQLYRADGGWLAWAWGFILRLDWNIIQDLAPKFDPYAK